jgi:hypothetical protein
MTIPSFTAESSLFGTSTYYYSSSWPSVKNYYYSNLHPLISQTRKLSLSERGKIPEPQREPAESGRMAWMALERACNHLQCEGCRKDCLSFINGLHDAINIKLGKPIRTPNDLVYLRDFINSMSKYA